MLCFGCHCINIKVFGWFNTFILPFINKNKIKILNKFELFNIRKKTGTPSIRIFYSNII